MPDPKHILLPMDDLAVRALHVGDFVLLTGRLVTARDAVHGYLAAGGSAPCPLTGAVIYHCGPIMIPADDGWKVTAAGPTTSIREEPYMASLIERFTLRAIIGKGGMGQATLDACAKVGCVYLHAVGGAAQVLADTVRKTHGVYLAEKFGSPEAMWDFEVQDFPAIVTMDSHGASLHTQVATAARQHLDQLLECPSLPLTSH